MNVLNERRQTHGDWISQSQCAHDIKFLFRNAGIKRLSVCQQEVLSMIAVKISRILHGNPNHPDHWEDIAGYATLALRELAPPCAPNQHPLWEPDPFEEEESSVDSENSWNAAEKLS